MNGTGRKMKEHDRKYEANKMQMQNKTKQK
jgi:hypothetical protein